MLTRTRNKPSKGVLIPSHVATSLVVNADKIKFGATHGDGRGSHRYFCQINFADRVLDGRIDTGLGLIAIWRMGGSQSPAVQLEWSPDGIVVTRVQLKDRWYDFKSSNR